MIGDIDLSSGFSELVNNIDIVILKYDFACS